jgi:hypothetical protein
MNEIINRDEQINENTTRHPKPFANVYSPNLRSGVDQTYNNPILLH